MSTRTGGLAPFFVVIIAFVIVPILSIGEAQERKFNFPHVRPLDASTRAAFSSGMKGSPLFRELVAQLEGSDLIVHVESDCTMRDRVQGKLLFVTAAGGVRYLRVRIGCAVSGVRQVAILGHELRHAVEVADAPWVVDESTMAEEYRRIGFPSRGDSDGSSFESSAAIDAGERILRDLTGGTR
jgi:hypothetical protein